LEVEIKGVFYDTSGYGRVNRNLARKLQESGVTVKVSPLHGQNSLSEDEIAPIAAMEDTKLSNNRILIDSIVPTIGNITGARYKILYTTIESYTVPDYFIRCCRLYNEIWLTSEWSASVLRSQLPGMPIHSMNPGVDCDLYKQEGEKFDIGYDSTFIFLSVFVWSYRKGYDVLLRAFMDEFSAEDRVTLLLLTRYNQGTHISGGDKIKEDIDAVVSLYPNKQSPHVARIKRNLRENEMPKLYRAADAFVLPTRGEGIGLPPMEASLCGLPVIMTNCSGQQDYLRPDNSFPIEIDRLKAVEKGQMHIHYWDGMEFPDLTSRKVHEDLKRAMRYTYTNREDAKHRNRNLQNLIIETFSCNAAANRAASRLSQIAANMRR
jgi:glycosyltransferase involved in cell wall biosynthesis